MVAFSEQMMAEDGTPQFSTIQGQTAGTAEQWLIDDFLRSDQSRLGTRWRVVSDQVMGGVSTARMIWTQSDGRQALCLQGEVSLQNQGGFVQINLDLAADGWLDARGWTGVRLLQRGNGARYAVHLKTRETQLPWQSYRAAFPSTAHWQEVRLPFTDFSAHRLDRPLDLSRLKRLGLVAIGQEMTAEVCLAELSLYRDPANPGRE